MIIDAHLHLWEFQNGMVNGKKVYGIGGGKSDFGGEIRQMMPPYMNDNKNTVEILISNMDYACVAGGVATQEYIDGNQDKYLLKAKSLYPDRLRICSLYEEKRDFATEGFDGVKICAGRLGKQDLTVLAAVFGRIEREHKFLSIDLAEGDLQTASMREMIQQFPNLKVAIGHFGMAGRQGWESQIKLAANKNVYIESGGITWLYHKEFYPYSGAIKAIKQAAETVGMDKLMWGSDYPRTMTAITYEMSYDFICKSSVFTQEEKEMFLGRNAYYFYGFGGLPEVKRIKNMVED